MDAFAPSRSHGPKQRSAIAWGARLAPLLLLLAAASARANGAFPDSMQILLPPDRPNELLLATNFGLFVSDDQGTHWDWVCEQAISSFVTLYALGPPPADRLFAVASMGLGVSSDGICSFPLAKGALDNTFPSDVFPDPRDPSHVFAIATPNPPMGMTLPAGIYESSDGGATFRGPIFTAPMGTALSGVEVAASNASFVYATYYAFMPPRHPYLARSTNGGAMFTEIDAAGMLGETTPRLAAVDPADPQKLYLRLSGAAADALAISPDGGTTFTVPLTLSGAMSAFLRRADGRIYVAQATGGGFVSADGGRTFTPWPTPAHLRALGERAGVLYGVGDNFMDGFALATSTDDGASWHKVMSFDVFCRAALSLRACANPSACTAALAPKQCVFCPNLCGQPPPSMGGSGCAAGLSSARGEAGLLIAGLLVALLLGLARRRR